MIDKRILEQVITEQRYRTGKNACQHCQNHQTKPLKKLKIESEHSPKRRDALNASVLKPFPIINFSILHFQFSII